GQRIRIVKSDKTVLGDFTISSAPGSVTDGTLTLTAAPAPGTYTGAEASKLLDTLRRTDGTSWLDSGFLEGQLIQIDGISGFTGTMKVELITTSGDPKKLDLMVLTDHPASPGGPVPYSGRLPGSGTGVLTVTQLAVRVTFTAPPDPNNPDGGNWFTKVTVPVVADPWVDIQPGHETFRSFPKRAHLLSGIRGPLAVEGGTTSADRSLRPAVLLPGEANGPIFNVPPQPPESQMIDTLNIYNDGTQGRQTG